MSSRNTKAHNCMRNSPNNSGDAPGLRRTVLVALALEQALLVGSTLVGMIARCVCSSPAHQSAQSGMPGIP